MFPLAFLTVAGLFVAHRETTVHLDFLAGQVQKVRRVYLVTLDPGEHEEKKEEGCVGAGGYVV